MSIQFARRSSAVVAVALCAALSGCDAATGGGKGADDLRKPAAQPSAAARAGGLGGAALEARDADGFTVTASGGRRSVQVARDACAPLAYALSGTTVGRPTSTVVRKVSGDDVDVTVVLAEYPADRAPQAMESIATALDACTEGFTATVDGSERTISKAAPAIAPEGVDQAMGLSATVKRADETSRVKAVVLRSGSTVAYLSGTPAVPAPVLDAQLVKLR